MSNLISSVDMLSLPLLTTSLSKPLPKTLPLKMQQQQQQYSQYEQVNHYGRPTARRRKSLLIGINYEGQSHALQGCRQDVRNMVS